MHAQLMLLMHSPEQMKPLTALMVPISSHHLTGKNIEHKFDDGIRYSAKVITQVPGYTAWYNVVYDNDESVYLYQLRTDLEVGDLNIL